MIGSWGGMEILAFVIAIAMYGAWRLWLALRGEDYKPEGKWRSRTDAMSEYMERTNPGSTRPRGRRLAGMIAFVCVELVLIGAFLVWTIGRSDR